MCIWKKRGYISVNNKQLFFTIHVYCQSLYESNPHIYLRCQTISEHYHFSFFLSNFSINFLPSQLRLTSLSLIPYHVLFSTNSRSVLTAHKYGGQELEWIHWPYLWWERRTNDQGLRISRRTWLYTKRSGQERSVVVLWVSHILRTNESRKMGATTITRERIEQSSSRVLRASFPNLCRLFVHAIFNSLTINIYLKTNQQSWNRWCILWHRNSRNYCKSHHGSLRCKDIRLHEEWERVRH